MTPSKPASSSRPLLHGPRWILALLGVALFALPLGLHRPGLPVALKADEPAYFLASLSLVHDLDLEVEEADLRRLFELYPYLPIDNLIVMSDDGWRTLHYGKPFLVSLLAAPLVLLFGSAGPLLLNLLLFFAMIVMGAAWLAHRGAGEGLAIFFSAGFFLLASAWTYVFWIHPEVLLMFATCGCLFFGLGALDARDDQAPPWIVRLGASGSLALSAAVLALGVYNKPMLAAMGLPICFGLLRRRAWRDLATWVGSALASMAAICALSWALTGQPTAYLVDLRAGFLVHDPTERVVEPLEESPPRPPRMQETAMQETAEDEERPAFVPEVAKAEDVAPAGWWWLLRWPETRGFELREDLVYFFLGRHTGLFVYMPFALLALLLFVLHGLRSLRAWSILLSLALVAAFFLLWIPFNWHGGGGFVGNRYFVMVYPAFLFLVERLRPTRGHRIAVAGFWALGGWLTGPLLLAPFGLMAPAATLQIHARAAPHQLVPMDFSLRTHPGYGGAVHEGVYVWGRKDQIDALRGSEVVWLRGAEEVDVWLITEAPLERIELELASPVPENDAVVRFGGEGRRVELGDGPRRVVFESPRPSKVRRERRRTDYHAFQDVYVYHLTVQTERGRIPEWDAGRDGATSGDETPFYRGASLRFVGSRMDSRMSSRMRE